MFVFMDVAGSDLPPNLSLHDTNNFSKIPQCMIGMVTFYKFGLETKLIKY